jgi:C4-dicarboxylate transporter DctM subunit
MYTLMLAGRYNERFSGGLVMTSSTLGMLLPPSVPYLLYALATGTSVAALFLSGLGAGIIVGFVFIVYSYFYAKITKLPMQEKAPWSERFIAFKEAFFSLLLIVIIFVGIYGGVFTVTEAAAVAAFYAIFVEMVIYRTLSFKGLAQVSLQSGKTIAMVMMLIAAGGAFSWAVTTLRIPQMVADWMSGMSPTMVLIAINIIFFVAATSLDPNSVILIITPLILPAAVAAGIDLIHLGTMIIINMGIGMITPPFALNIFVGSAVFKRPVEELMISVIPFIIIYIIVLIVFMFVPALSTWLPRFLLS